MNKSNYLIHEIQRGFSYNICVYYIHHCKQFKIYYEITSFEYHISTELH